MNGPRRSLAALLFLPFAAVALPDAAFERGGVTFDPDGRDDETRD